MMAILSQWKLYGLESHFKDSPMNIDLNTPIQEAKYIVVDTELTGLDAKKASIISIGAIKMNGSTISLGDFFYRIVKTDTCVRESILIHEITPSESAECPDIGIIMKEFIDNCTNRVIVGHFIDIDMKFLNTQMKRLFRYKLENPSVDTYRIYKWMWKRQQRPDAFFEGGPDNKSLFELAKKFDIHVGGIHNAIYDAFVTAQLFQKFLHLLNKEGIKTLKDLLKIGEV
ncbi:DNA polymerase III subunit epsilon [hot springs metagenome]|uniref:DNA polymerase III subunit epsilon n=1 Tax=hot springs metagenome TaxID=433727 RepID=A0A5J4L1Z9_9ZZZZ